ncbi:MAG TPA: ABC transporter permease [Candidatus Dormibacteraeota bacterium]|jgi:hypothetical protein|nr:ABC transporter permease [Candidatus Dormibacteraeota bacterium]
MRPLALPAGLWQRELSEFLHRPRSLAIKMLFPLAVAVPLLHSSAPAFYAALALTMVLATMAPLGAGAVLARERTSGLLVRYRLLPCRPLLVGMERLLASAGIDLIQVTPVLILLMLDHAGTEAWWPALWLGAAATLLVGNVLGALASTLSRSPGEVMLFVLLPTLPALYLAGIFTPFQDPVHLVIERLLPFSYLHAAILGSLAAPSQMTTSTAALSALGYLAAAVVMSLLVGGRLIEADA